MTRIVIDPVTRIEGHARITIDLDDTGAVRDAHFQVTQFRGFETLCAGRPFAEMPSLMARICGICPVSHLVASAKACDALLAVQIPATAIALRRVINLAQLVQSHALSFFHLSSPDLLLGMDADPAERSIFGIMRSHTEVARDGIRLRQIGQEIIETLGGKRVHPAWVVPGGVAAPLSASARDRIAALLPDGVTIALRTLDWFKSALDRYRDEIRSFGNFPTLFLGLVGADGELEYYDGHIRVVDATGIIVADGLDPLQYATFIGEAVEPWTYTKFPYFLARGYPAGLYRVGPLARLNLADRAGATAADQEWAEFRNLERGAVLSSFHYHLARLIEILAACERMQLLLENPGILDPHVRAFAGVNNRVGVGVAEAPRGTLIHRYEADENGLITAANLIVATGHNNLAMNRAVLQVARHFVHGPSVPEGMLNRVEAVIRAFDPCLSCSTHALGQMPLLVELRGADGTVLDRVTRG